MIENAPRKTIKVGESQDRLVELPDVQVYDWQIRMTAVPRRCSLLVKGLVTKKGAFALKDLSLVPGLEDLEIEYPQDGAATYTFSAVFKNCEITSDGYEFTEPVKYYERSPFVNEDDTV
jgi:hypothetical protein